ncbi:NAD(P)-dependent oxidoreductase [Actinomadura parmotrematis]|uniref:NAD(P)-dependent oxidoreductase n=1 Tax=Actinomadura parmotrematis TaxID=2864039 RepID=A0ABS7FR43_9ACTN|nr:NAD(P)-dependent oxidoreductase [Actinomadura parmotrematis]MBW8482695.1 NAD(P)-dependent oxidoreductase [Actinomadura parmotrematis]
MRVGFIGLGSQGGPMARRIVEAGHPTTLWARRPATLEAFAGTAAAVAASPAELGAASDIVCVCVVDDAGVEEVVSGPDGVLDGLAEGGTVIVHSTVHPDTPRRLAERGAARGVSVLDAPVSGGGPAAEQGRLLVMVGGDADVLERCRPVLAAHADPIVHLGPLGAGQVAKLLNNVLFTANLGAAAGTVALGRELGVDAARLAEVIAHGSGASFALDRVSAAGGTLDRIAAHAGALLRKDVGLIASLAGPAAKAPGGVVGAATDILALMDARPVTGTDGRR